MAVPVMRWMLGIMTARPDLGRRHGVFVPSHEVEAHLACGWSIADELAGHRPWPGTCAAGWFEFDGALMAWPAMLEEAA